MNIPLLDQETEQLLLKHESEPEHTHHVARLANDLLEGFSVRFQPCGDDRLLLRCAALLHDTGWSLTQPDGKAHHKASALIISDFPWQSLNPDQIHQVAAVARYHRKALPSDDHLEFFRLREGLRSRTLWLAACLRLADGLDCRHLQRVEAVRIEPWGDGWTLRIYAKAEIGPELLAAEKKSDLLLQLTEAPLRICLSEVSVTVKKPSETNLSQLP